MTRPVFGCRPAVFLLLMTAVCFTSGCGDKTKPKGFPKLYPCYLTLLQEGKPVEGVQVQFVSKGEPCPWPISGLSDSSGSVKVVTYGKYAGAPEGKFAVTLSKTEIENAEQLQAGGDLDAGVGGSKAKPSSHKVYSLIDVKYTDQKTTPLEISIDRKKTTESFDLGPAVKKHIDTLVKGGI